ncbi:2-oxoacid:acceptor oxidoreductase subunit alpha [Symmachiella dynata]|uniref:2-oxoglutarate oxidoreductase subunit KorA n=1 Tax=Symmachiella dynata TaxID=2527995 RepID=A0A517ZW59_9PLAN|nr:2-oxoacid:acceptor oxidoreductase subunit alpha [Symmachiella dynata]QDU46686.1 2-oxoglutarate oxidoreductase subunit KorA [Symmachiella dynata]
MAATDAATSESPEQKPLEEVETVVVRFCGDSGDGMQLAGTQLTNVSAVFGNDVVTLPDFPAEIRAPAGTLGGVSGFQISFSSDDIFTPGDEVDTLVAMNPAALKTNIADLKRGGTLIVNEDAFEKGNLQKAHYDHNPLENEVELSNFRVHKVPMTRLTRDSVAELGLSLKIADRCKNFFALGLVFWLYDRDPKPTTDWITTKFGKNPAIAQANMNALTAGSNYGFSTESFTVHYQVPPAKLPPGKYRKITGNEATAIGLATAAKLSGKKLFYAGYPITPASDILHELSKLKNFGVRTCQVEDEIAAMTAVVGAAYSGELAVTASSGPGICLKAEAMGLGVMTELPMVIINVQRGGPSTGLPTKTEQSDLMLAMYGRNGDCPLPVVAASAPADCFKMAQEAFRLATEFMTPVILLTDGYIANGAEPWRIPEMSELRPIEIVHPEGVTNGDEEKFLPYARNEKLTRPWAIPGTPGLQHRVGGLEKSDGTGNVDYSPENHEHMVKTRQAKVDGIANFIPEQSVEGPEQGDVLVLSWGGTYGSTRTAVRECLRAGKSVALAHLQYLNPMPRNLGEVISKYKRVLIPELNTGQLRLLIRSYFLVDAVGYNKIQGKPFLVSELVAKIDEVLADCQDT